MGPSHLSPDKEGVFPDLRKEDYRVTSDEDWAYNCIAYAAGSAEVWWWPTSDEAEGVSWPPGIPKEETVDAFVAAFGTLGFVPCENSDHEHGFEKVAIFLDEDGRPTHAAKQLHSGFWTSKLGRWEDIEHKTLDAIVCPIYGKPGVFLKREISETAGTADGM